MKKLFLPALMLGMSMSAFAQSDSDPCCAVISVDAATKLVTARDKKTGMLYQFKADNLDIKSITTNDVVVISNGKVTSVSGATRMYPNIRVSYGAPCCAVVNVQPDPIAPCCGIITYSNKSTNELYKFQAPKQVSNNLKVGDPVYAEPAGRPSTGMAVVYSGNVAYGFPAEGAIGNAATNSNGDVEPCCNVVGIDKAGNNVLARDKTSGRLYQFKADGMDINSIKNNDVVNVVSGKITSINGSSRNYPNVKVSFAAPCCNVVDVQPDPAAPCCNIITFSNQSTNALYKFKAPKNVANNLNVGDPVYIESAGKPATKVLSSGPVPSNNGNEGIVSNVSAPLSGLAVVYLNAEGQVSAYGYPIETGDGTTGTSSSTELWTIKANNQKGVTGRYVIHNLPKNAEWNLDFYVGPDNKWIKTVFSPSPNADHLVLAPDKYRIKLNNVAIENVPINKGHDTELKFGLLNVVSGGEWHLYKEKQHLLTKFKPTRLALSPGTYRLNLGGADYSVVIKEGKTEEY